MAAERPQYEHHAPYVLFFNLLEQDLLGFVDKRFTTLLNNILELGVILEVVVDRVPVAAQYLSRYGKYPVPVAQSSGNLVYSVFFLPPFLLTSIVIVFCSPKSEH